MKKCIFYLLMLSVLLAVVSSSAESFFPQISDIYGTELPSLGEITMCNPIYTEKLENGSTLNIYDQLGETYYSWYYSWGELLKKAGCSLISSNVENGIFSAVIGKDELTFYFLHDVLTGQSACVYPEGSYPKKLEYCRDIVWIGNITASRLHRIHDAISSQTQEINKDTMAGKIPLRWYVLEKEEEKAYVFSAVNVGDRAFSPSGMAVWENSDIRNWLNTEFFETSFTEEEKEAIIPMAYESFYIWDTKGPPDETYQTEDRIVLLQWADVEKMPNQLRYNIEIDDFILRDIGSTTSVRTEGPGSVSQDRESPIHPAMWVDLSKLERILPEVSPSLYEAAKALNVGN